LNRFHFSWLLATLVVAAILFFGGCEDPLQGTGQEVLPSGDAISFFITDSSTIEMATVRLDRSDTYRSARQLLGNYVDPEFGRIDAKTFLQVLPQAGLSFGSADELKFDSLVLFLDLQSAYGTPATPQTLHVYELAEGFPETEELFSDNLLACNESVDLSDNYRLSFPAVDSVTQTRVRLGGDLGERILFADSTILADRDLFFESFPGFCLGTDPVRFFSKEPGAIYSLFASSQRTYLQLYYQKKDTNGVFQKAEPQPFIVANSSPRYTALERLDWENRLLGQYLNDPDTSTFYEFVQGGTELRTFVRFPNVDNFPPAAISQAQLTLKVATEFLGTEDRFEPPFELILVYAEANGDLRTTEAGAPILLTQPARFNADAGTYTFTMTNYIQQLITGGQENTGFYVLAANASLQVDRVIFGGTSHPTLAPVLSLTASTLPE